MVFLSFEKFLWTELVSEDFGKAAFVKNAKERQNISKIVLDSDSGCKYLDIGACTHRNMRSLPNSGMLPVSL